MAGTVPTYVRHLPLYLRQQLASQCEGDWRRVTQEADGSVIVHNKPQMRTVELPPQGVTRTEIKKASKRAAKKAAPPPVPPTPTPATRPRTKKSTPRKAVFEEPSLPGPLAAAPVPAQPAHEPVWRAIPGSGEEKDPGRLADNAYLLSLACAAGLPAEYPVKYHADVLALAGVDLDAAEGAIRHPERVVIAEQTGEKGYPILRFHKASVCTVVGFRSRSEPSIIAVYFAETIDRTHGISVTGGGGGARKKEGVPRTVGQLITRLKELGAQFDPEVEHPEVTFEGSELGKITLSRARSKDDVEKDWQRIQRKIDAIRRRAAKVS